MDSPHSEAVDNGRALHVKDVPWADKQMWAPDAAEKEGNYSCSSLQKGMMVYVELA